MTQFTRYPVPQYDKSGELVCPFCKTPVTRSVSRNGDTYATCATLGCANYAMSFLEGSEIANPSRTR